MDVFAVRFLALKHLEHYAVQNILVLALYLGDVLSVHYAVRDRVYEYLSPLRHHSLFYVFVECPQRQLPCQALYLVKLRAGLSYSDKV